MLLQQQIDARSGAGGDHDDRGRIGQRFDERGELDAIQRRKRTLRSASRA
jgi:hypothetical protein